MCVEWNQTNCRWVCRLRSTEVVKCQVATECFFLKERDCCLLNASHSTLALCLSTLSWHPILYVVPYRPKVMYYGGNRVPFG